MFIGIEHILKKLTLIELTPRNNKARTQKMRLPILKSKPLLRCINLFIVILSAQVNILTAFFVIVLGKVSDSNVAICLGQNLIQVIDMIGIHPVVTINKADVITSC